MTAEAEEKNEKFLKEQSNRAIDFVAKLISSGIFVGYIPFAPGTMGSLLAVGLFFLLNSYILNIFWIFLPAFYFLGVWSASRCEVIWGKDSGKIVIDEIVGMLLTLVFMPLNVRIVWLGFFLFRAFDIIKPQPARWSEKLFRGWGVMTDDLIAGIYANLALRLIIIYIPWVS